MGNRLARELSRPCRVSFYEMRRIQFALALALLAVLITACGSRQPVNARIDPALAMLIPPDAKFLAGARMDKLKNTPFYRTYVEGKKIQQLEEFQKFTGLDPRKDLWEFLAVSNGTDALLMARGKFGGDFGLEPNNQGNLTRTNYKGYSILESGGHGLLFMNTTVAVVGRVEVLKALVDRRNGPAIEAPRELMDMVSKLPANAHVWVVTQNGGALIPRMPQEGNLANITHAFASLGAAWMYADLTDGMNLKAEGSYPDEKTARQIQDVTRGFVGLARLRTPPEQQDLNKLYDAINVQASGPTLKLSVLAPFDLIQEIVKMAETMAGRHSPIS
jgi:hypothetical protein